MTGNVSERTKHTKNIIDLLNEEEKWSHVSKVQWVAGMWRRAEVIALRKMQLIASEVAQTLTIVEEFE